MARRILVIDDERDMQVYLRTLLRRAGYEVEVAGSGEEGLLRVASFHPDLITLDILMPRGSGAAAYRSLREGVGTQPIPVVVITGLSDQRALLGELAGLPPPELIVEKPIDREDFLRRIAALLGAPP